MRASVGCWGNGINPFCHSWRVSLRQRHISRRCWRMTSILNPPNTIYFSFCDVALTRQPTLYIPHSRQVYEFNITDLIKPARLWQILSRQSPFTITISHRKKLRLTRASISPRFAICRNLSWKALRKWQQIHILLLNATVYPYIKPDVEKGNQPFQSVRKSRSSDWWNLWPHTGRSFSPCLDKKAELGWRIQSGSRRAGGGGGCNSNIIQKAAYSSFHQVIHNDYHLSHLTCEMSRWQQPPNFNEFFSTPTFLHM